MEPQEIPPDTKDWTVVITQGCRECGFDPGYDVRRTAGDRLRATVRPWLDALARPDVRDRPGPTTWSPLEYACHVRDVNRIFLERLGQMLAEDGTEFANWDQDAASVEGRYGEQDPGAVGREYAEATERLALAFDDVQPDQWERRGLRSNGAAFTVETLAVYLQHDLEHHLHDVAR